MNFNYETLRHEVSFKATRSRGPGGQNVNKVSSAALLIWDPWGSKIFSDEQKLILVSKLSRYINRDELFTLKSDEYRDLERNKTRCLEKLSQLIEQALTVPKKRKKTKPTKASKERRIHQKKQRSEIKKLRSKFKY